MHSKTHFKFQFKSSRISTTSVHVIFFLNTKLHHDTKKIGSTQFGSTNLEIYILQNSIKNWINELAFEYTVTVRGVHLSASPHVSDKKNRGRGFDGAESRRSSPTATPPVKPRLPTCSARGEELIGASGTT